MFKKLQSAMMTALLALTLGGCGASDGAAGDVRVTAPPPDAQAPVIEEPDIYRVDGDWLYVQNYQTGLNILDISDRSKPRLVGRAPVTGAAGDEMYLSRRNLAVVMLKSATSACQVPDKLRPEGWSFGGEVVFVDTTQKSHPKVMGRYCLPGKVVASRTVDQMLYVVTTNQNYGSRAISIDIADPHAAEVVQQMEFFSTGAEIKVTADMIYVAAKEASNSTLLQLIAIDGSGTMTKKGTLPLEGTPQGRFHMDLSGDHFRIVTYDIYRRVSRLSVVDVSKPGALKLVGTLDNLAPGEKLHATRFDGDMVYIVTYRRTDPLWIVSLAQPSQPKVVGELHVPGWSDFLFPRGKTLIAVGRGDNGGHLGVSLFDVSDPKRPRAIDQMSMGDYTSSSEANVDHRGVTILDIPGENPLVVVPYTAVEYGSGCQVVDRLHLVEVTPTSLRPRGSVTQKGTIRRSVWLDSRLYSISDYEILSVDIANLDMPRVDTAVTVGLTPEHDDVASRYCDSYGDGSFYDGNDVYYEDDYRLFHCSVGRRQSPVPPLSLSLLALLALLRRRR